MIKKCLVGVCIITVAFASTAQSAILLDRVMAIVNKEVITWSDLYREMEFNANDEVKAMKDEDRRSFFRDNQMNFLENLIETKLQLQEASKDGIAVSEADVETAVKNIKSKYSMTDEKFNETIMKEGLTPETYKQKLREQIILSRLIDTEVRSKILVSEQEVDSFLSSHKDAAKDNEGYDISHIFLRKTGDQKQLEQKAQDLYKRLKAGENFAELAARYSEDESARSGGELGFIRLSDMSAGFLKICSGIKPGDISEPQLKSDGMDIIRVNEARIFKSENELREAMRQKLLNDKFNAEMKIWTKGLRDKAYVEIKT